MKTRRSLPVLENENSRSASQKNDRPQIVCAQIHETVKNNLGFIITLRLSKAFYYKNIIFGRFLDYFVDFCV